MNNVIYVNFKTKQIESPKADIYNLMDQTIKFHQDTTGFPKTKEMIEHGIEIFSRLILKAESPELKLMTEQYLSNLQEELKQLKQG